MKYLKMLVGASALASMLASTSAMAAGSANRLALGDSFTPVGAINKDKGLGVASGAGGAPVVGFLAGLAFIGGVIAAAHSGKPASP